MVSLLLDLLHYSHLNSNNKDFSQSYSNYNQSLNELIKQEENLVFSNYISKYAMFPLLFVGMMVCVSLNIRLVWIWYTTGEINTIVNKFIVMQRICILTFMIGEAVDYFFRLYGPKYYTFISEANYCSCWLIFYKGMMFGSLTANFSAAIIRLACVKYSLKYHQW